MLTTDRLIDYLVANCRTDLFWLETVGRTGLYLLDTGVVEGRQVCRLQVVRLNAVGETIRCARDATADPCGEPAGVETRISTSPVIEGQLTNDDFLVLDDSVAVRLVFDDHNRFVYAALAGHGLLDRYRFIRDTWWPSAERT